MFKLNSQANLKLLEILKAERPIEIVDIGANPIDGVPPYRELLDSGIANLVGFEPQASALAELLATKSEHEQYLPYVIGDGEIHTLHIYQGSGLASLLKLDDLTLNIFAHLKPLSRLLDSTPLQTKRLDDVDEIRLIDYLKIDIQGGELSVFKNAKRLLTQVVCIQTEVSFIPLYQGQPTIGDVDSELRSQGFIPHCFAMPINTGPIAPVIFDEDPWKGLNQLGEADMVYVKDFRKLEQFSDSMLKNLAIIMHFCYRSMDLVAYLLVELSRRELIQADALALYLTSCQSALETSRE